MTVSDRDRWDVAHEWKTVALLPVGSGLVGDVRRQAEYPGTYSLNRGL